MPPARAAPYSCPAGAPAPRPHAPGPAGVAQTQAGCPAPRSTQAPAQRAQDVFTGYSEVFTSELRVQECPSCFLSPVINYVSAGT
jgi:hypothetical protein